MMSIIDEIQLYNWLTDAEKNEIVFYFDVRVDGYIHKRNCY